MSKHCTIIYGQNVLFNNFCYCVTWMWFYRFYHYGNHTDWILNKVNLTLVTAICTSICRLTHILWIFTSGNAICRFHNSQVAWNVKLSKYTMNYLCLPLHFSTSQFNLLFINILHFFIFLFSRLLQFLLSFESCILKTE